MSDTSDVAYAIWLLTSANGKSIIELICEKLQQITNNEDFVWDSSLTLSNALSSAQTPR